MAKAIRTEQFLDDLRREVLDLLGCIDEAYVLCGKDRAFAKAFEGEAAATYNDLCEPLQEAVGDMKAFKVMKQAHFRVEAIFNLLTDTAESVEVERIKASLR